MNNKLLLVLTLIALSLVFTSCSGVGVPPPVVYDLSNLTSTVNMSGGSILRQTNDSITFYPSDMTYYFKNVTTGELKIYLPHTPDDAYITMKISARENSYFDFCEMTLSGQATSAGWNTSTLQQTTIGVDSDCPFPATNSFNGVGFTTGLPLQIGAGFSSNTYTGLEWRIEEVTITGTNTSLDWVNGWSYEWNTLFGFPSRNIGQVKEVWNSLNDGAGSLSDADMVDGLHADNFFYTHTISNASGENYENDALIMGNWKGRYINDSFYYPDAPSGGYSNVNVISDLLGDGSYIHQLQCKPFQNECVLRSSGTGQATLDHVYLLTSEFGHNTTFTGNHTQIGEMNITEDTDIGGNLNVEGVLAHKNRRVLDNQYWSNEFTCAYAYCQGFWYGAGLNSGTFSVYASRVDADHPGVNYIRANAGNTNGGAWILTSTGNFEIAGGESSHFIFQPYTMTNVTGKFGFWDSWLTPVDSLMIEVKDGYLYGVCSEASSRSTTATNYSLTASTWYNAYFTVNENATEVFFELYDSPMTTLLWNDTITTNIPDSGDKLGHGITSYLAGTAGATTYQFFLDFMDLEIDRYLDR